jgi:acetylornithine deacetylase/succinyl-diaminopimelate desuccinylase-like protein
MTATHFLLLATLLSPNVDEILSSQPVVRAMGIVEESHEWAIEKLISLTEIPAPPFGEDERADAYMKHLEELGLEKVWKDEEGNVYGEKPGKGDGPTLVFSAHLDTVFPKGTDVTVKRDGNRLRAPGVMDDTVGLVTVLTVLKALQEAAVETDGTIIFMGTVGEEGRGDLRGVKYLFRKGSLRERVDLFISIDGSGDKTITNKGLGSRRYKITYKGPGGHSWGAFGTPNPGFAMGRTLAKLGALDVPTSPKQSYNVGVIGGGTSVNSVPYEMWMEIDLRGEDVGILKETEDKFLRFVEEGVEEENRIRNRKGEVWAEKELIGDRPSGEVPDDAPLVQTAVEVTRRLVGVEDVPLRRGSTDSNIPISMGIPAITIGGGGEGADAHALTESFDATNWARGINRALVIVLAMVGLHQ